MCHLLLLMPILGLPIFWLWPTSVAAPSYIVILLLSGWLYYYVIQAMRRPVETGPEEILHSIGKVVGLGERFARVRVHSEVWNAESPDKLRKGDLVTIEKLDGLILTVRRYHGGHRMPPNPSQSDAPSV